MKILAGITLAFLLTACGGGDDGSATGPARFAFVTNGNSSDISAYTVDGTTGALTQFDCGGGAGCNGSNFRVEAQPSEIVVTPNGAVAYTANYNGSVSAFRVDTGTGALTRIDCGGGAGCTGANFTAGGAPTRSVAVDPTGSFLYAANTGTDDVSAYLITAATGALTQVDCGGGAGCNGANFASGDDPDSMTMDPAGTFLYVVNGNSSDISVYTITPGTGVLAQVDCGGGAGCSDSQFDLYGAIPQSIAIDPAGSFLYTANGGSGEVSAFSITAGTGALTQIYCGGGAGCSGFSGGRNFAAGDTPVSVTVDPSGAFVYVTNELSNDVSAYAITAGTGSLTQIDCGGGVGCIGANFAAGTQPRDVTVEPDGGFAYVGNVGSDDVTAYLVDATTGVLTMIDCGGGAGCTGGNFTASAAPTSLTTTR